MRRVLTPLPKGSACAEVTVSASTPTSVSPSFVVVDGCMFFLLSRFCLGGALVAWPRTGLWFWMRMACAYFPCNTHCIVEPQNADNHFFLSPGRRFWFVHQTRKPVTSRAEFRAGGVGTKRSRPSFRLCSARDDGAGRIRPAHSPTPIPVLTVSGAPGAKANS